MNIILTFEDTIFEENVEYSAVRRGLKLSLELQPGMVIPVHRKMNMYEPACNVEITNVFPIRLSDITNSMLDGNREVDLQISPGDECTETEVLQSLLDKEYKGLLDPDEIVTYLKFKLVG